MFASIDLLNRSRDEDHVELINLDWIGFQPFGQYFSYVWYLIQKAVRMWGGIILHLGVYRWTDTSCKLHTDRQN